MWSRKFKQCVVCDSNEIEHVAKGYCRKCYTINTEAKHKKHNRLRGVAQSFLTKDKLYELYVIQGKSLIDIGKLAKCTRVNVHYKLRKFGIVARSKADARTLALDKGKIKTSLIDSQGNNKVVISKKIRYNSNFFKEWSAAMAYLLGLIFTDGNLHFRKNKSGYKLGVLSFGQKDIELVEKFLNLMACDAKIRFRKKGEYNNPNAGELYFFNIGNNDIANDLIKLGLTANKSLDMKYPYIPSEFTRHFIRGIFDGDGSVYLEYDKYIRVKLLSGSKEFMLSLKDILINQGFLRIHVLGGTLSTSNAYVIKLNTKLNILKFYDFIYKDVSDDICYLRKRKIFQDFFKL